MTEIQLDDQAIFEMARHIHSPDARQTYLQQACGTNLELHRQVTALLNAFENNHDFLECPPVELESPGSGMDPPRTMAAPLVEQPGTGVGHFKLVEQIGEGGMGVVYLAEQTEPVRRKVALKIIKPGMDSRQVMARFEAERQALAMMDHPNIAKVLDAGATDAGRPYFVMELVQGVPITEYCDECHLTTPERLALFTTVCQAVQHAHQKGVIHRDLKPTNVLVAMQDGRPAPKIIDFGVAKAIRGELTEQTLTNVFVQMVGTPLYMSPEQAELSPLGVDTRSDIYSLGVLLYELLTGSTPFDSDRLQNAPYDELRRIIREEEPPRPSSRISTLAAGLATTVAERRRTDTRRLLQAVCGELDWIVMKALDKDRTRRYDTASKFAEDVQHYLDDEPVLACPPSRRYRLQKLFRRHQRMFLAIIAVIVALLMGLVATGWQSLRATQARDLAIAAEGRAVVAEDRAAINLRRALDAVDQMLTRVGDEKLANIPLVEDVRRELLEDAVQLYGQFLDEAPIDPRVRLETAMTERRLAQLLFHLGRTSQAESSIERSIALLRQVSNESPNSEQLQLELARSLMWEGAIRHQLAPLEQAVPILRRLGSTGATNRVAVMELAFALSKIGLQSDNRGAQSRATQTFAEAQSLFDDLLSRNEQDHELRRTYAKHVMNYGILLARGGDWQAAEEKHNQAVGIGQSLTASQRKADDLLILASAFMDRGSVKFQIAAAPSLMIDGGESQPDYSEAAEDFGNAVSLFRELVRDHTAVPLYHARLAGTLLNQMWRGQDPDLVIERGNEAIQIMLKLTEDFPTIVDYRRTYAAALSNVANALMAQERELERAEQLARHAIQQQTRVLEANSEDPTTNHFLANHYSVLAEILSKQGNKPRDVVDTCDHGLQVAERLRQRYPNNEFVSFLVQHFQEMKQAAEQVIIQGDAADVPHPDR